ncbi:MAG: hypothetical protein HC829_08305, partial [Bacteroidales bacterium]|nr:hypothetical protein [Bacteroidales bacterium]
MVKLFRSRAFSAIVDTSFAEEKATDQELRASSRFRVRILGTAFALVVAAGSALATQGTGWRLLRTP